MKISKAVLLLLLPLSLFCQLDSTRLPIVFINTNALIIPDEPKITADMGIIYNGPGQMNRITDPFNEYDGKIGVELRGSTSQFLFPKKQYAVETRDINGANANVSLLGLPRENDWILHAPYSDKTLMRNALAYKIAGEIMDYAPRYRYCELILNGNYQGVYLLMEKIKRDNDRVDIARLKPDENEGDALTGGYILKIDKFDGAEGDGFVSNYPPRVGGQQSIFYQYHYPKPHDITEAQRTYIQGFVDEFEDIMFSNDFSDPENGYVRYIDLETFIDYMLINEVCKNVDAYRISTFLYKDRDSTDGRLKMGPVWDFNLAFGNVDFCMGPSPQGWVLDYADYCPDDFWLRPAWWSTFLNDTTFRSKAKERWFTLREGILSRDSLQACINELIETIGPAQERNFNRWPVLEEYVWPNAIIGGSYEAEVEYLEEWLWARLRWMDFEMNTFEEITFDPQAYFDPFVYPNPSSDQLTFEYYVAQTIDVQIIIYDAMGRVITILEDLEHPNGANRLSWEIPTSISGMIFYSLYFNEQQVKSGSIFCNK